MLWTRKTRIKSDTNLRSKLLIQYGIHTDDQGNIISENKIFGTEENKATKDRENDPEYVFF